MRNTLVAALVACANFSMKPKARRFLLGLSSDELQFIAEYLGLCILEAGADCNGGGDFAEQVARLERYRAVKRSADRDLKLILLREYLCRAGVQELPVPVAP